MNSDREPPLLFGETAGQFPLARFIDHRETYGPHIVDAFVAKLQDVHMAVDLGAGSGRDLGIVKKRHPKAHCVAIEAGRDYADKLAGIVDQVEVMDIEKDSLPFENETVDLVVANQVLEHTKEIFWIFHQVTRVLKIGGHFLVGVPNIASFHNRLLLLAGRQPTQHKLCSAHVRPFSKADTVKFLDACFPGGYQLREFAGAQFYPFPTKIARFLSRISPAASFSIFFLFQKEVGYTNTFVTYPARARFETNFWSGPLGAGWQYK